MSKQEEARPTPGPWVVHPDYPLVVVPTVPTDNILPDGTPQKHAMYANVRAAEVKYGHPARQSLAYAPPTSFSRLDTTITWEEAKANARLIAAAPDLLAALKAFVKDHDDGEKNCSIYQDALAAIAKATGEPLSSKAGCYLGQDMIGNDPDETSDIERATATGPETPNSGKTLTDAYSVIGNQMERLASLRSINSDLLAVLIDLAERAERCRRILQENSGGNWGMLDTDTARAVIAKAEGTVTP